MINSFNNEISAKRAEQYYYHRYKGLNIWKYNYIVGYLEICYTGSDIVYVLYSMKTKKYLDDKNYIETPYSMPLFTEKKHYMTNEPIIGIHRLIERNDTNKDIGEHILHDVKNIIERNINKKFFVDLSQFYMLYDKIDYLELFDRQNQ